jgi:hypothetical protein
MTMKNLISPKILTTLLILTPCLMPAANTYIQHNLVSDQAGVADFVDANLVNPWGICTSATSPFWLSDAGTGLSTLYTSIEAGDSGDHRDGDWRQTDGVCF